MGKIKIFLFFIVVLFAAKASAQKLYLYKTFGGVVYMLNDTVQLSTKQAGSLLFQHPQAYSEFKKARRWSTYSAILGFTGAAAVAIPVATLAFGERSDWGLVGGGAAIVVGSILYNRAFKARTLYAIDLYNASLPEKTSRIKPQLQFYGTGARLVIRF